MDTEQNSTEQLSPQAIARLFEMLSDSLRAPLDRDHAKSLAGGGGYDWAARIAVKDAFEAGADPWHVAKIIGGLVCERAERDLATPGAQTALDMLDLVEQLRIGRLDPEDDQVRWRLLGMIAESDGSMHVSDAAGVLDAALDLILNNSADDTSSAQATLERTAGDHFRNVHMEYELRHLFAASAPRDPSVVLRELAERLGRAAKPAPEVRSVQ